MRLEYIQEKMQDVHTATLRTCLKHRSEQVFRSLSEKVLT